MVWMLLLLLLLLLSYRLNLRSAAMMQIVNSCATAKRC
jgi:hypothetical protein